MTGFDTPRLAKHRTLLILLLVTAFAAVLRLRYVDIPPNFVFDEFYASDGCHYIGRTAAECRTDEEITVVHPPLGKWLIGMGVWSLGFRPAGWRIASVIAGTLTVAAVYLLAQALLSSTLAAVFAAGLLAIDPLHLVLSRTAMLDVFVTFFVVLAFLFAAYYRRSLAEAARNPDARIRRHYLAWAGIAAGAAGACKWSAWPCLAVIIALAGAWEVNAMRARGTARATARAVREGGPYLLLYLIALPALVYVASYAGRLDGTLTAWPWSTDSWVRAFVERQFFMLEFHTGLSGSHPYTSPAWSWLLLKRPVLLYFREPRSGVYEVMLAIGNPLVWWSSLLALLYLAFDMVRRRSLETAALVILAAVIATYVPWLLLDQARQQVFAYYVLPVVPFMCLALAAVATRHLPRNAARIAVPSFMLCALGLFLFYRPILVAKPLTYSAWRARMLFTDCDNAPGTPLRPATKTGPSPRGWCWP
jgi:dolichyl-phosphate-mannose-protein mannosyltransferase